MIYWEHTGVDIYRIGPELDLRKILEQLFRASYGNIQTLKHGPRRREEAVYCITLISSFQSRFHERLEAPTLNGTSVYCTCGSDVDVRGMVLRVYMNAGQVRRSQVGIPDLFTRW